MQRAVGLHRQRRDILTRARALAAPHVPPRRPRHVSVQALEHEEVLHDGDTCAASSATSFILTVCPRRGKPSAVISHLGVAILKARRDRLGAVTENDGE